VGIYVAGTSSNQAAPGEDEADNHNTVDPDLPMVPSRRLEPSPWQRIDSRYVPPAASSAPVVTLANTQRSVDHTSRVHYGAQVVTPGSRLIALAMVNISLLDGDEVELARTQVPVVLVGADMPQMIAVILPPDLADRTERIEHVIEVQQVFNQPVIIDPKDIRLTAIGQGRRTVLHLTTYNPSDAQLAQIFFLIKAVDSENRLLSQWRVLWDEQVEAHQRIEFHAPAPMEDAAQVQQWVVTAVGDASF
jgi:hypothetical protein